MREMLTPTSALVGMGLMDRVLLITDGRFSGGSTGAVVGHISPEAARGGLIGLVLEGDPIEFNLSERRLDLLVPEDELERRRREIPCRRNKPKSRILQEYADRVESASRGAVFRRKQ